MHADALPASLPQDPGLSSEFHRWPLPGYLWAALERHTQSIFCTEPHLRIHGGLTSDVEAWVQRDSGRISGLWLFRRRGHVVRILNEVASVTVAGIDAFADAVFTRYRDIDAIEWHALHLSEGPVPQRRLSRSHRFQRPCQSAVVSDDYVLDLPASIDAWHGSLSRSTHDKLRQCQRRAQRHRPAVAFRLLSAQDITDAEVRAVLQLSRARMRAKGNRYGMDARAERALCALMRERGWLAAIEIDGRLCAGLLCTLAGRDLYMHVIAHDPHFDALRPGYLCCALAIEAAIAQRLQRFHFLWGWYDYKVRLGGQRRVLEHGLLWRGWLAACRHPLWLLRQQLRIGIARMRERRIAQRMQGRDIVH